MGDSNQNGKITNKSKKNYTVVPNEILKAKDLTWKAKGLMCYLLSMSDEWDVYKKDLANRSLDGYESMLSAWKELEALGYIQTIRIKNQNLFNGYEYIINDSRVQGFTEPGITEPENPDIISNSIKQVTLSLDTNVSIALFTFEMFWKIYPVKRSKIKCQQKWSKLKKLDIEKISKTIKDFVETKPFQSYTHPYPMTYLNSQVWNDIDEVQQKSKEDENKPDLGDLYAQLRGY